MIPLIIPYYYMPHFLAKNTYKNMFFKNLLQFLKTFLPNSIIKNNFIIKNYIMYYIIKIKNLSSTYIIDCLHKYNYFIDIQIPSNLRYFKCSGISKFFILYKFPFFQKQGVFILNGIKRILVPNLIKYESLNFIKYKKSNYYLYTLNFIFLKYHLTAIIEFNIFKNEIYFICHKLNLKINFIHVLYSLNITNKFIFNFSTYGNTILLKNILYISSLTYKFLTPQNNFLILLKLLYSNIYTYFIYNFTQNIIFKLELIRILDLLFDFILNKKYYNNDSFSHKKLNIFQENFFNFIKLNTNIILTITDLSLFNQKKICNYYFNLYKEILLINPLFRILEETNLLTELTNFFKIINYDFKNSPISVRDFKLNQLNNFCILHTSEGTSSGLILSKTLTTIYKTNLQNLNFYSKIPISLSPTLQEHMKLSLSEYNIKKLRYFNTFTLPILWFGDFTTFNVTTTLIPIQDLRQLLGPSESLIPFILFTDPTRCLMGAKMQTQASPILGYKQALILTGTENYSIYNSNLPRALQEGVVSYVSSIKIIIRDILNREIIYYLGKYRFTTQLTIKNSYPIVWVGERVNSGQILVNDNMSKFDELSLGVPVQILYGSYFGYDYEDSIVVSQQLIYNNIFSSIHINYYENFYMHSHSTVEYSSVKVPNSIIYFQRHLNKYGVIKEGSYILTNDIIISKIIKKSLKIEFNNLYILIDLLFGTTLVDIINTSIKNNSGICGRIIKVELFFKNYLIIRIFLGTIRLLEIGDKLCGRHGNKGIISYISKSVDLPYNKWGGCIDIIAGSLGIPSRMNLGQLYEGLFGISNLYTNTRLIILNILNTLIGMNYTKCFLYEFLQKTSLITGYGLMYNTNEPGKIIFKDGRSGQLLKGTMCLGIIQYFKLIHMIRDKIQARTTGIYTNITQQPVRGRARQGGQRFGEMEVWSLEAFGASYTLRELLMSRSDDIEARNSLHKMLIHNKEFLSKSYVSEPFKIILKELNSLALNMGMSLIYSNISEKIQKILIQ